MKIFTVAYAVNEHSVEDQRSVDSALRTMYAEAWRKSGLTLNDPHTIIVSNTWYGWRYCMEWKIK